MDYNTKTIIENLLQQLNDDELLFVLEIKPRLGTCKHDIFEELILMRDLNDLDLVLCSLLNRVDKMDPFYSLVEGIHVKFKSIV